MSEIKFEIGKYKLEFLINGNKIKEKEEKIIYEMEKSIVDPKQRIRFNDAINIIKNLFPENYQEIIKKLEIDWINSDLLKLQEIWQKLSEEKEIKIGNLTITRKTELKDLNEILSKIIVELV